MAQAVADVLVDRPGGVEHLRPVLDVPPPSRAGRLLRLQPAPAARLLRCRLPDRTALDTGGRGDVAHRGERGPVVSPALRQSPGGALAPLPAVARVPRFP